LLPRQTTRWHGEAPHRTHRAWWLRGATALVAAYVVASQALLDVRGWSVLGFAFAAVLAGVLTFGSLKRVWTPGLGRWVWVPVAFLGYCLLRSFSGIKDTHPFDVLISVASAFLGGIAVAVALRAGVRFRWLVYAQVASNLLQIIIVCFGLGPEPALGEAEDAFRYSGMVGNANVLALQLTFGACMIWLLPKKAGWFPCLVAVGSVAFAVAVTGSRKAVLVAFLFLVLVCLQAVHFLPQGRRRLWMSLAIAVPCLLGLFLAPSLYQYGQEVLAVRRSLEYQDSSYQTRAEMVEQGLGLWEQAPLFGNGLDSFRALSGQGTYSHNNYIELLCCLGMAGTLLFYAVHAGVLLRAARAPRLLKYYCWIFVLTLLLADIGYVSYKNKQTIMILMLLTALTTSRYALKHRHRVAHRRGGPLRSFKPRPRRFVLGA